MLGLTLSACGALNTQDASWNIKEVSTVKYVSRINRSTGFIALKKQLEKKGLQLAILDQDSDTAKGALAGIYADGLYYSFTDEDTARHIRERTGQLMREVLGPFAGQSEWVISYCIDFSNGIANSDIGYIKAELYYTLSRMSSAHFTSRPHNLASCKESLGVALLYERSVPLTATLDGAKTVYKVSNPAKPLREVERFDLLLSDLTYQAAEVILTDPSLVGAIETATQNLPDPSRTAKPTDKMAVCKQLQLQPDTAAFKECLEKLSR